MEESVWTYELEFVFQERNSHFYTTNNEMVSSRIVLEVELVRESEPGDTS